MAAVRFLAQLIAKLIAFVGMLALLVGLMLYFHVGVYAYLASAFAGSLVIYLWTRPGFSSLAWAVFLGAGFAAVYQAAQGIPDLAVLPAFFGLGSLASLCRDALRSGEARRQASLDTLLTASMFPVFLVIAGFCAALTSLTYPKTYDLYLYAFDAQLGGHPSFAAGRLLEQFPLLRRVCYYGYEGLPLAIAVAFALERARPRHSKSSIMLAFTVAAAGGFLLYNWYPAVGPIHIFGSQFPYSPPPAGSPPFRLVAAGGAPRNAMPSVHIAMALLILWNARAGPRVWQWAARALLGATILATLGFGEHYVVDLFVAAPFALLAQALAAADLPCRHRVRVAAAGAATLLVMLWLAYLRLQSPPLYGNGALAWTLLLATAVVALFLEFRLARAAASAVNQREQTAVAQAQPIMEECRV